MANNPISYAAIMTLWNVALPGFVIISSVSEIVNVMCLAVPAAVCLLILCCLGAITIVQWDQRSLDFKMWNHCISMCTGRWRQQSFWNYGLFPPTAEVLGFLEYQIRVEGIVLCFWSSIRCIKIGIAICYRGLRFPQRSEVLLVLESDAACTSLSCHTAKKSAVLVLVWRYKPTGDREQDLCRYWLPEHCIKQWCDKPIGADCLCKWCGLWEEWSSDIAVSCTLPKFPYVQYANTRFRIFSDQYHWPESPLM